MHISIIPADLLATDDVSPTNKVLACAPNKGIGEIGDSGVVVRFLSGFTSTPTAPNEVVVCLKVFAVVAVAPKSPVVDWPNGLAATDGVVGWKTLAVK